MPIRIPSHIYRNRHGGLYFRYIVPNDLQSAVGKREVRLSLQTELRADAIMSALHPQNKSEKVKVLGLNRLLHGHAINFFGDILAKPYTGIKVAELKIDAVTLRMV